MIDDAKALQDVYGLVGASPRAQRSAAAAADDDPTATAGCGPAATSPVNDGDPIVVSMPPAPAFTVGKIASTSWRNPPSADPTWRMNYLGLMWMKSLARRAAIDGQTGALDALVDQSVKFYQQNPDPKNISYGWDEGTALRRLESMNCLYALTQDAKLKPGMTADVNVLFSSRYYGPPNYKVHNHGLMANLQLVRASDQLGVASWKAAAVKRMVSEAPQVFSKLGIAHEQSSEYQNVNANLWTSAANALEAAGETSAATSIRATVTKARTAYEWMTEPDGKIVQIGDSDQVVGVKGSLTAPRVLRDDQTGWVIGRWSWTDPNAVFYTIRYGPSRWAHGQHDRAGGVTFTGKGVRALVGPGRFSYDKANNYALYQLSPSSHNVALPSGKAVTNAGGTMAAATVQTAAHGWSVKDTMFGIAHTRGVNVNRDTTTMKVSDTFGGGATLWCQYWHLDPAWKLTSGGPNGVKLVFTHPSGRKLTVTTTGRVSSLAKGITRPPAGWNFPKFGSRVQNYEIVIRSYGKGSITTFQIS
ncbi:hypothetical protein [Actinoplanes sp. NBRC 103695]|uniref:hypothetical protein n=1 Tax=Actinoplanes sp. NBRC 103695 TaxID=3032202 RepID=UPI0024A22944|nr:hypothetical protein [Actinoplanes sp. NBRC 103695]GLY95536.1 hypothetical protein Acsp02_27910 [Actinoplanes sp. NBRC 103695]